ERWREITRGSNRHHRRGREFCARQERTRTWRNGDQARRRAHRHRGERNGRHRQRAIATGDRKGLRGRNRGDAVPAARHEVNSSVRAIAESCKRASRVLSSSTSEQRVAAIRAAAQLIEHNRSSLLETNAGDLDDARHMLESCEITAATFERLRLTDKKIAEMTHSMLAVAELPDPVGRILQRTELDANLVLEKITCPVGVLAIIFEARPDAVTQISALGLKSANAVILKAGREVERTAHALVEIIRQALTKCEIP